MGVLGDIQYRAALVWKVLNGNATTTRKFLRQVGTGAASAAPGWDTLQAADLPSTAVTPASYGDATHVAAFTVDQQGRLTAASSVAITDTGITTLTGDVTAGPGSGSQAATLANTTVTPASYTNTNLTVDSKGRITAASNGSAGGSGTVTNTGTLTNHALIKGNGGVDVSALGSLGTTTTVLHGNAAGDPSYGAVVEADITLANNTTNNVTTSAHGFAPILPNDATKYLDGTGLYSSPAGSGATAVPIVVTTNTTVTTNNGWVIPESLEIAAGIILEVQGGARVEITGPVRGSQIQLVNTQTGSVASGTTAIPEDDTIPQITEGTEFLTASITPTSAANHLRIDVVFVGNINTSAWLNVALFRDAVANALAAARSFITTNGAGAVVAFTYYMTAGGVSPIVFRVRAGTQNGTAIIMNGSGTAGRIFGGVMASSITVTEINP